MLDRNTPRMNNAPTSELEEGETARPFPEHKGDIVGRSAIAGGPNDATFSETLASDLRPNRHVRRIPWLALGALALFAWRRRRRLQRLA